MSRFNDSVSRAIKIKSAKRTAGTLYNQMLQADLPEFHTAADLLNDLTATHEIEALKAINSANDAIVGLTWTASEVLKELRKAL